MVLIHRIKTGQEVVLNPRRLENRDAWPPPCLICTILESLVMDWMSFETKARHQGVDQQKWLEYTWKISEKVSFGWELISLFVWKHRHLRYEDIKTSIYLKVCVPKPKNKRKTNLRIEKFWRHFFQCCQKLILDYF